MVEQFLVAGNDTTTRFIAEAGLRLATDTALADTLRRSPEMIVGFLEECLRFHPPVNGIFRQATVDYDLGGVKISAGESVWIAYASANRDPACFEVPEQFDVERPVNPGHLAFGFGEHFCLGATLARTEARIVMERFLSRCQDISLTVPEASLTYDESFMVHGLKSLPLRFAAT